jgi:leader peptidase (prepilin peptidase)/N-methyltransferase
MLMGVLGAVIGSFLGAAAVRWPEGRSVARGRSACDACGRRLRAAELVPLLSALWLRGRCRGCGARIDPVHGWLEAGGAAVGASAALAAGDWRWAAAGAVFGWLLLLLAALDLRTFWLPDRVTGTTAAAGLAAAAAVPPALGDRLIGGAGGYLALWLVAAGYRRARGREGMGGGDPKMLGAIGLWLGWRPLPAVLVGAALIGLAWALALKLLGREVDARTALPFGALMAAAAYPAWLAMIGTPL